MTKLFARNHPSRTLSHGLAHRRCSYDKTACSDSNSITDRSSAGSCSCGGVAVAEKKPNVLRRLVDLLKKKDRHHRHSSQHKPMVGLYLVKHGDTLADIAFRHEMHEMELRSLNKIKKPKHQKKKLQPGKHLKVYRRIRTTSVPTQCLRQPCAINLHDLPVESQCECDDWNLCTCRPQEETSHDDDTFHQHDQEEDNNSSCHYARASDYDVVSIPRAKTTNLFRKIFQRSYKNRSSFSSDRGDVAIRSRVSCQDQSGSGDYYDHDDLINMHRSMSEMVLRGKNKRMADKIVLPELIGGSEHEILSHPRLKKTMVAQIENCLPHAYRGYDWKLAFSCLQHGSNMHTLLHKLHGHNGSLILIETAGGEVFGAFNATAWKKQPSYYGSGQSFVFSSLPKFEFFPWTRANSMFMMSNDSMMAMGGGGDGFAWCLNSELTQGTTNCSKTFNNKMFTHTGQFDVVHVEAWTFVPKH